MPIRELIAYLYSQKEKRKRPNFPSNSIKALVASISEKLFFITFSINYVLKAYTRFRAARGPTLRKVFQALIIGWFQKAPSQKTKRKKQDKRKKSSWDFHHLKAHLVISTKPFFFLAQLFCLIQSGSSPVIEGLFYLKSCFTEHLMKMSHLFRQKKPEIANLKLAYKQSFNRSQGSKKTIRIASSS